MEPLQVGMAVRSCLDNTRIQEMWYEGTIMCIHKEYTCIKREDGFIGGGCERSWIVTNIRINADVLKIIRVLPEELKDKDRNLKEHPITIEEVAFFRWDIQTKGIKL